VTVVVAVPFSRAASRTRRAPYLVYAEFGIDERLSRRDLREPEGASPSGRPTSRTTCLESAVSVGDETVNGMTAILGYARVSTTGQDSKNRPFFAR
jgi:hypothetical protein